MKNQWCGITKFVAIRIGTMIMTIPWASYQIPKIAGCACAGNAGNVFPRRRFQRKLLVSDPGMHHGTCVTHVPWCMSGSLTCGDGENVPGIPGACAPAMLRIWQEAHTVIGVPGNFNEHTQGPFLLTEYQLQENITPKYCRSDFTCIVDTNVNCKMKMAFTIPIWEITRSISLLETHFLL